MVSPPSLCARPTSVLVWSSAEHKYCALRLCVPVHVFNCASTCRYSYSLLRTGYFVRPLDLLTFVVPDTSDIKYVECTYAVYYSVSARVASDSGMFNSFSEEAVARAQPAAVSSRDLSAET